MKRTALALIALSIAFAASAANTPVTTVILVRHAEKAGPSGDVALSAAGVERSNELARVLSSANVTAIYATQYVRTQQTAAPLAASRHLQPVVITAAETYARDVVAAILRDHKGETVVVVGHSNTTPDVIRQLGVASAPAIADSDYDNLYIVSIADGAAPKLIALHYGAK